MTTWQVVLLFVVLGSLCGSVGTHERSTLGVVILFSLMVACLVTAGLAR